MSISSIGSSMASSMMPGGVCNMQRPDPGKMAEDLFSKLDSNGQGYIDKSELESAFSQLDGSSSTSVDDMFTKMDGNGDGKVTGAEMETAFKNIASQLDDSFSKMRLQGRGSMPPPPPPSQDESETDEGFTLKQLTEMSESSGSLDSKPTDLFSLLAENFDEADSNGDGKIIRDEAMSFAQNNATGTSASGDEDTDNVADSKSDRLFMRKMAELLKSYNPVDTSESGSVSLTV
jgi:Ca2+-binding EF-hand superfamily protein